jgi:hypothetical protein
VTAIPLARRLPGASCNLPERLGRTDLGLLPRRSYSVLLPVGFAVPFPSPEMRCALTAPFHPCRGRYATCPRRSVLCGTVPGLCPEGLVPPDVIRHRLSMEPGLSSPAVFRHWRGAAVRPTDRDRDGGGRDEGQAAVPAAVKNLRQWTLWRLLQAMREKSPGLSGRVTGPGVYPAGC